MFPFLGKNNRLTDIITADFFRKLHFLFDLQIKQKKS